MTCLDDEIKRKLESRNFNKILENYVLTILF